MPAKTLDQRITSRPGVLSGKPCIAGRRIAVEHIRSLFYRRACCEGDRQRTPKASDRDALSRLLDFVELESIRKSSQLTEEEAAHLADEVDRSVWERVKHKEKIVRLSRLSDEYAKT